MRRPCAPGPYAGNGSRHAKLEGHAAALPSGGLAPQRLLPPLESVA